MLFQLAEASEVLKLKYKVNFLSSASSDVVTQTVL